MKNLSALFIASAILLTSTSLFAQTEETNHKFYDFEHILVEGNFQEPTIHITDSQQGAQFERLLRMETSFMNKIAEDTNF